MILGFYILSLLVAAWLGFTVCQWHFRGLIGGVPVGAVRLTRLFHCQFAIMRRETLEGLLWNSRGRTGLQPQLTVIDGGRR
jgi:hypothetical protein